MNERVNIVNMRFTVLTSYIVATFSLLVAASPTLEVCFLIFNVTAHCHCGSLCLVGKFDDYRTIQTLAHHHRL